MKKSLIAGAGVAALGMAALPFAGVFAANNDGTLEQTDTVVVTVDSSCSLATTPGTGGTLDYDTIDPTKVIGATYTATIANGQRNLAIEGSTFEIICNDTTGWKLNAIGAGTASETVEGSTVNHVDYMDASTGNPSDDIHSNTTFTTGDSYDGATSGWAFKLAKTSGSTGAGTVSGNYGDWSVIPTSATQVAGGASTASTEFDATYGVGISSTQSAGNYTGKITYTLVHPVGS